MAAESDPARELLRHTIATLAYRGSKTLRDAEAEFTIFRASQKTRTPTEILAHIGDLLAWDYRSPKDRKTGVVGSQKVGTMKLNASSPGCRTWMNFWRLANRYCVRRRNFFRDPSPTR